MYLFSSFRVKSIRNIILNLLTMCDIRENLLFYLEVFIIYLQLMMWVLFQFITDSIINLFSVCHKTISAIYSYIVHVHVAAHHGGCTTTGH